MNSKRIICEKCYHPQEFCRCRENSESALLAVTQNQAKEENQMKDYQQRVVEEKKELDSKTEKLLSFINRDVFRGLSAEECKVMRQQLYCMMDYSRVLADRITLFG